MAAQHVALLVACEVQPGLPPKGGRPPLVAPSLDLDCIYEAMAELEAEDGTRTDRYTRLEETAWVLENGEDWPLLEDSDD